MDGVIVGASIGLVLGVVALFIAVTRFDTWRHGRDPFDGVPVASVDPDAAFAERSAKPAPREPRMTSKGDTQ